jgi:hypothetical protein
MIALAIDPSIIDGDDAMMMPGRKSHYARQLMLISGGGMGTGSSSTLRGEGKL